MPRRKVLRGRTFDSACNPVQWKTCTCCDVSFSFPEVWSSLAAALTAPPQYEWGMRDTKGNHIHSDFCGNGTDRLSVERQEDASLWWEMRLLTGLGALSDLRQYWAVKETFYKPPAAQRWKVLLWRQNAFFPPFKSAVSGEHRPLYGSPDLEEAQHQD